MKAVFFNMLLIVNGLMLANCTDSQVESLISGEAQGTTYHIKFVLNKDEPKSLADIQHQITTTLADIDTKLSNYRDDSEISLLNQKETTDWLKASPEIIELLQISKTVYAKSGGCFDLTIKPLFDLWGFSKHQPKIPRQTDIDALKPHIGMELLDIDTKTQRIRKRDPYVKIDLASIAQGYSVGSVAKDLESLNIQNYMVEIGGEMMIKGRKANGQPWRIGIESPTPSNRTLYKAITLNKTNAKAVMTAGTYRNFFETEGKSYSHILNPKTGWPVDHQLRSVTVIHDDPSWADAWDTALLCMGEKPAIKTVELEKLNVFLVYEVKKEFKEYLSPTFNDSL
jgi:FAD:protein FMN transferase